MSDDQTLRAITDFLDQRTVAGLATVSADGSAHASNIVYACDTHGHVYFLSGEESRHAAHLVRAGHAAISVYAHDGPLAGVQAHGPCRVLVANTPARAVAAEFYASKLAELPGASLRRERVASELLFCLRITWARLLDTSRKVPIEEWRRA